MGTKLTFDCSLGDQLSSLQKQKSQLTSVKHCGPKNVLLVEGSKEDRLLSENNTALLERVWILSRPPQNLKDPQPTVSARRVQIVRSILDGEFGEQKASCPPNPCKEDTSTPGSTRASSRSVSVSGG